MCQVWHKPLKSGSWMHLTIFKFSGTHASHENKTEQSYLFIDFLTSVVFRIQLWYVCPSDVLKQTLYLHCLQIYKLLNDEKRTPAALSSLFRDEYNIQQIFASTMFGCSRFAPI